MLVLAVMRAQSPQKYERSPYSTVGNGRASHGFRRRMVPVWLQLDLLVALLLLALGAIAIASALGDERNP